MGGRVRRSATQPNETETSAMKRLQHARNFRRTLELDVLEGRQLLTALHGAAVPAVDAIYMNLLKRMPDAGGLSGFTQALQTGSSLAQVANTVVTSPEFLGDN